MKKAAIDIKDLQSDPDYVWCRFLCWCSLPSNDWPLSWSQRGFTYNLLQDGTLESRNLSVEVVTKITIELIQKQERQAFSALIMNIMEPGSKSWVYAANSQRAAYLEIERLFVLLGIYE